MFTVLYWKLQKTNCQPRTRRDDALSSVCYSFGSTSSGLAHSTPDHQVFLVPYGWLLLSLRSILLSSPGQPTRLSSVPSQNTEPSFNICSCLHVLPTLWINAKQESVFCASYCLRQGSRKITVPTVSWIDINIVVDSPSLSGILERQGLLLTF